MRSLLSPLICTTALLVAGGVSAGPSASTTGPQVDNRSVRACAELKPGALQVFDNILLMKGKLTVLQPLSRCGCVSSELRYTSSLQFGTEREVIAFGKLDTSKRLKQSTELTLLVAADGAARVDVNKVVIALGCDG